VSRAIREVIVHTVGSISMPTCRGVFRGAVHSQPDNNLNIAGLSHGAMTGLMLEGVAPVPMQERPDMVLVYGYGEKGEGMFGLASNPVANRCCGCRHGR
jgi:UDP-GlcNAc3NAcA epimerase